MQLGQQLKLWKHHPKRLRLDPHIILQVQAFSPEKIATEIEKELGPIKIAYNPDFRQNIADSWPDSIDDKCAKNDWEWSVFYDLPEIIKEMIKGMS